MKIERYSAIAVTNINHDSTVYVSVATQDSDPDVLLTAHVLSFFAVIALMAY